jgi:hypothetical protein
LADVRYTIKLWIPSYQSALTGAQLRCESAVQTLPAGVQECRIVRFLPSASAAGAAGSVLLSDGEIISYESSAM